MVTKSEAQKGYKMEYGVLTGVANYLGEIGGKDKAGRPFIVDLKFAKSRWTEGVFVRYKFHPQLSVKASLNYLRIAGADNLSTNPGRRYRNLSFRNDIYDMETTINWLFYSSANPSGIYRRATTYLTAYLFTGMGVFYHNPKTLYQGSYIPLQPVKTEGVTYSRVGYCIPFGFGMYVGINKSRRKSHRIGLEVNWRYTNTDYLDDISTVYKNPSELPSATAIALSNRNPELTTQPDGMFKNYGWQGADAKGDPINKAPRGNPNNKDSYMTISVSYGISFKSRYTRSRGKKIRTVKF
ncbi:MAG: hypothetical protein IT236_14275 [Bacteroidia bacterium]|nr:hypothetical protein [Bacteroidia bacterium]